MGCGVKPHGFDLVLVASQKKGEEVMVILVVDDTTILRSVLKDILVEFCDVQRNSIHEAADGYQAVSEYKRLKPDIVFLDISMPGLSGIEAVKQIIEMDEYAKIVMCTGAGERAIVRECIHAGAVDYLIKPLQPTRVVASIRKAMGELSAEDIAKASRTIVIDERDPQNKPTQTTQPEIKLQTDLPTEVERVDAYEMGKKGDEEE